MFFFHHSSKRRKFHFNFFFLVTNEVPEHPVVSTSSGAIFEKRIIEKYILENGCDPISGKEIKIEELIDVKSKFQFIYLYSIFY